MSHCAPLLEFIKLNVMERSLIRSPHGVGPLSFPASFEALLISTLDPWELAKRAPMSAVNPGMSAVGEVGDGGTIVRQHHG